MSLHHTDPASGLRHGHIRHPDGQPPTPQGCRWCGTPQQHHGRRWSDSHGVHAWEPLTAAQVLARMRARRAAR
ncbi:hypothetical protein [Streptomyces xiamenensis]|uniref:hypothetical protein n=1 Tax=Streptomyces xiamenensis TaxID=408015 RepID=UPI0037CF261B